jgi:hypothetical protein
MSDRACVNAVCQISRGYDKKLLRKLLRKVFPRTPDIHHTITLIDEMQIVDIYYVSHWHPSVVFFQQ